MATSTQNLGLLKAQGGDYIDQTLVDNFGANWDKIDQEIVKRVVNLGDTPSIQAGLEANKPAVEQAGALYIATDTARIYRSNGSTWQLIATINWNDIAGKPSTFTPSAHTHNGNDITSAVANATNADMLDGKHASEFAAASHTHTKSQITDFAHKSTHAKGGTDALTAADIGAVRCATVVIAASNSSITSKNAADYVCNGSNDSFIIQQAINSLGSTGGTVLLLEGEYNITTAIGLNSNVTLKGVGKSTILKVSSSFADEAVIINSDWADGNSNIEVCDLVINGINYTGTTAVCGIHFEIGDNNVIRNVDLYNLKGDGIFLYDEWNLRVLNCRIKNCNGSGINLSYCDKCILANNIISECNGGLYGAGIFLQYQNSNCLIKDNLIYQNLRNGILLYQGNTNLLISNNEIFANSQGQSNSYSNIVIANYNSYVTLQGNICRKGNFSNTPAYGIMISNSTNVGIFIVANDLYQSGNQGNIFDNGSGTVISANRT